MWFFWTFLEIRIFRHENATLVNHANPLLWGGGGVPPLTTNRQYLSSASEVGAAEETIYPTSTCCKLLISAVTHGGVHCFSIALIILWDTLSWRARLLITHPRMFISGSLLAFFLPPAGSLVLLLSSSDRRWSSVLFFHQSLPLLGSTEKHLAAASPDFSSAYFKTESLLHRSHGDHQCDDWQKASTIRDLFFFLNKLDSALIWNRLFTKLYTSTRRLKGNTWCVL